MSPTLSAYIVKYGYMAIFSLVFLQEIGVPNPVPNEVVLLFSGYLASVGKLDLMTVWMTAASADVIASSLLYMTFYHFGQRLLAEMATCHINEYAGLLNNQNFTAGPLEYLRRATHAIYPWIHCCCSGIIKDIPWSILTRCARISTDMEWRLCHRRKTPGAGTCQYCCKVRYRKSCSGRISLPMPHWLSWAASLPLLQKQKRPPFRVALRQRRWQKQPRVSP